MPKLISKFLTDRNFSVRIGNTLSDSHQQQEDVPQGSILSVTLFSMKINDIVKCLLNCVNYSLYVDNFLICYQSMRMMRIASNSPGPKQSVCTSTNKEYFTQTEGGQTLPRLYRVIIRSQLDYGSIVWASARKSYIKILVPIHHQDLRIATGAFSLYVESNEESHYRLTLE